jgi:hypothetical protein
LHAEGVKVAFAAVMAALLLGLWRLKRPRMWLLSLAWVGLVLSSTQQVMPWHILSLLPLIPLSVLWSRNGREFFFTHAYLAAAYVFLYAVHL